MFDQTVCHFKYEITRSSPMKSQSQVTLVFGILLTIFNEYFRTSVHCAAFKCNFKAGGEVKSHNYLVISARIVNLKHSDFCQALSYYKYMYSRKIFTIAAYMQSRKIIIHVFKLSFSWTGIVLVIGC